MLSSTGWNLASSPGHISRRVTPRVEYRSGDEKTLMMTVDRHKRATIFSWRPAYYIQQTVLLTIIRMQSYNEGIESWEEEGENVIFLFFLLSFVLFFFFWERWIVTLEFPRVDFAQLGGNWFPSLTSAVASQPPRELLTQTFLWKTTQRKNMIREIVIMCPLMIKCRWNGSKTSERRETSQQTSPPTLRKTTAKVHIVADVLVVGGCRKVDVAVFPRYGNRRRRGGCSCWWRASRARARARRDRERAAASSRAAPGWPRWQEIIDDPTTGD